jgi:cytochrome c-type biogenesis protein CcmF
MNLMAFTPDGKSATIKVILEPFVPWIWIGGLVVAFGAVVSAWPTARSSRRAVRVAAPALPAAGGRRRRALCHDADELFLRRYQAG